jgi:hypothetical protein
MTSPQTPTPNEQTTPASKSLRRIHLQVWLPIVIGLALAFAFIQTRNRYHDPRENALPAPKWDGSAADPSTSGAGASTIDVPTSVNLGGEIPLQIELPDPVPIGSGQTSAAELGGTAHLTGQIEVQSPTAVAGKPGLPWKR